MLMRIIKMLEEGQIGKYPALKIQNEDMGLITTKARKNR
jgi:hypothetical protein